MANMVQGKKKIPPHTHKQKKTHHTCVGNFCRGSKELIVPLPIDINHNERVDVLDIQP